MEVSVLVYNLYIVFAWAKGQWLGRWDGLLSYIIE